MRFRDVRDVDNTTRFAGQCSPSKHAAFISSRLTTKFRRGDRSAPPSSRDIIRLGQRTRSDSTTYTLTVNETGCGPEPNCASSRCSRSATHRPPQAPVKPCFVSGTWPEPASCSLPVRVRRSESPNHVLTATLRIRRTVTRRTRQSYIGDYASSSARAWIAPFTGSDICVDRTQRSNHRSSDVMPACLSRCWVIAAESVTVTVAGNLNSKGPRRFLAGTDAPTECKQ